MKRANVIKVNILSALATTFAAVVFYQFGQNVDLPFGILLGLVAGFFIYIAVSDIIPSIHKNEGQRFAGAQTVMLVVGVVLVSVVTTSLHSFIDAEVGASSVHTEDHHEHESDEHMPEGH